MFSCQDRREKFAMKGSEKKIGKFRVWLYGVIDLPLNKQVIWRLKRSKISYPLVNQKTRENHFSFYFKLIIIEVVLVYKFPVNIMSLCLQVGIKDEWPTVIWIKGIIVFKKISYNIYFICWTDGVMAQNYRSNWSTE